MDDETALNYSLHELIVQNPWFSVHPLEWTVRHLDLLRCRFQTIDATPNVKTYVHREETVDDVAILVRSNFDKYVSFLLLLLTNGCPFKSVHYGLSLQFGRRMIRAVDCDIFVPKTAESMKANTPTAALVGAFLQYDRVVEARGDRLGQDEERKADDPVQRNNDRRFRLCTPMLWYQDPYLVFVMLSLAQFQSFYFESARYPVCLVVSTTDDNVDAHVYHTIFPEAIIDQLYAPTSRFDVIWPTIYHIKIPYHPYGTFFDRLMTRLQDANVETVVRGDEAGRERAEPGHRTCVAAMI